MDKTCLYPPPEICNTGISLGTTTNTADSSFGSVDQDDSTTIVINAIIGAAVAVVVISLILVIGICLFRRHRKNKSLRNSEKSGKCKYTPSDSADEGCDESLLRIKTIDNNVGQTQVDRSSASIMGVNMRTNSPIYRDEQDLTSNEQTENAVSKNTSTDNKISGASSGFQQTPSPSSEMIERSDALFSPRCRLSSQSNKSDVPLLSRHFDSDEDSCLV